MEVVPDCSRLNWRVISNRQPPMKLAPVRDAPGRRPVNGVPPKPRRPRQAPAPGRDTLSVPLRGGLSGNGMLPAFFAASVAPSRGVWGTKLCPFFCSFFNQKAKSEFRPCFQKLPFKLFFSSKTGRCRNSPNLANDDTATKRAQFDQNRATATTHQIW